MKWPYLFVHHDLRASNAVHVLQNEEDQLQGVLYRKHPAWCEKAMVEDGEITQRWPLWSVKGEEGCIGVVLAGPWKEEHLHQEILKRVLSFYPHIKPQDFAPLLGWMPSSFWREMGAHEQYAFVMDVARMQRAEQDKEALLAYLPTPTTETKKKM